MDALQRLFDRTFVFDPDAGAGSGSGDTPPPSDPPTAEPAGVAELVASLKEAQAQIAQLQGELISRDSIYKGLQTKYNNLSESQKALQTQVETHQVRVAELEANLAAAAGEKETLVGQIQTLETARTELETYKSTSEAHKQMVALVADKYQNLLPMIGTLEPKNTPEATEQMLQGLSHGVEKSITASVQALTAGYVPGGNFGKGTGGANATESADALLEKAMAAAGTKEYDGLIERYFAALQASNQMPAIPMPKEDTLSGTLPQ